ncbi:hypothetical protein GU926_12025 [Nibribacter ruber]|uniref:DUF4369 domain-containing protein n=1 Tax=Nibribacter ruber TaxID=2698458 RepID=A0A6P1P0E1_9BACT|nr:hypothetical protein [Nibribacter ruber]QHL88119.1 hypothetical protein GU926_12025 [Nibribacter ruber]
MKNCILTVLFLFTLIVAQAKEITAHVIFENRTGKQLTAGKFYIPELEKTLDITSAEGFTVTLPEKGKYSFGFRTDEFEAYTMYPARITENKNIITVRLEEKPAKQDTITISFETEITQLEDAQLESMITKGKVEFIFHSIQQLNLDFGTFQEKYGIGYISKNCIMDPLTLKASTAHNKRLEAFLNQKYGEGWKKDLPLHPFGIE